MCVPKEIKEDYLKDINLVVPKEVLGQWSSWSSFPDCPCAGGSQIKGLRRATRKCVKEPCHGPNIKYMSCTELEGHYCDDNEDDLSSEVEHICQKMSLQNPDILPFGDAQNTSSCQVHCFKAGPQGGSMSSRIHFPDGTICSETNDHLCVQGSCKTFSCDDNIHKLSPNLCDNRSQRQTFWTQWKTVTGCTNSCIVPGSGLRLVTRECTRQKQSECVGLRHSVQLCQERSASSFLCQEMLSPDAYASKVCSKYKVS